MKSANLKREEGAERNAAWRALDPLQQLASLDRRLGKGIGADRQRMKLTGALLQPPTTDDIKWAQQVVTETPHKKAKAK